LAAGLELDAFVFGVFVGAGELGVSFGDRSTGLLSEACVTASIGCGSEVLNRFLMNFNIVILLI